MKLIKIEIKDDTLIEITCKPSKFKNYKRKVDEITRNLNAKDLWLKYYGRSFDVNGNIVFTFRTINFDKDTKPYIEYYEKTLRALEKRIIGDDK